jgi:hypothetical protein
MVHRLALLLIVLSATTAQCGPPPYPIFEAPTKKFEPSAAAYDHDSGRIVVLNDKDAMIHAYKLKNGKLEAATLKPPELTGDGKIMKFEAMAPIPGTTNEYLALCAFDRDDPAYRRAVRFKYEAGDRISATPIDLLPSSFEDAVNKVVPGKRWYKFEGVAFDGTGSKVFLGIRNIGSDFKTFDNVVVLLRCPFDGRKIGPPERAFHFSTRSAVGAEEGLSDFVRDPQSGDYWLLTSKELGWKYIPDHGGHLFKLPAAWLDGEQGSEPKALDKPLAEFTAKCEALVLMPDGRKLVIFDSDDDGWKKHFDGFAPNKAMYQFLP